MKWRINFSIPNCNYNIIDRTISIFADCIPQKNGQQLFKEWYLEFADGTLTAFIPVPVIDAITEWLKDKVIADPEWADKIHKECEEINRVYFVYAKELSKLNLLDLDNAELYKNFLDLRRLQSRGHSHAIATTWFIDSNGEIYSNYLRQELEKHLLSVGVHDKVKTIEFFITLTTPYKKNFTQEEQIDFLELLKFIQSNKANTGILRDNKNNQEVMNNISIEARERINEFYEKWHWTPYGYIGPAYSLYHYLDELRSQLAVENISDLIKEESARNDKIKLQLEELEAEIKLPEKLSRLFKIARDIIWLKDFRKMCFYHGHYVLDKINSEFARRLRLSLRQINHVPAPEFEDAILRGKFDENAINERISYSLMWSDDKTVKYYYGEEARKIKDSMDIEKVEIKTDNFSGTCACPGSARGKVKIVHSIEDVSKVESGDIMLAITTHPAFLPAMKRAAAIITEDGGITCHAAIVAREFRIPCVVGVKKICSVLRDNEEVEVDATEGIIRKIK